MSYTISQNQFDGNFPPNPYTSVNVYDEHMKQMAILIIEDKAVKAIHVVNVNCSVDKVVEAVGQSNELTIECSYLVVNLCRSVNQ